MERETNNSQTNGMRGERNLGENDWLPIRHPASLGSCRCRVGATALAAHARAQAGREDDQGADCSQREATAHAADVLRRQPAARRAHEGAASGDDRPEPAGHPRVVPEQALQGQEEVHPHEAAPAAAAQRQGGEVLAVAGRRAVASRGLFLGET